MKERPILFSSPMVTAILSDIKKQTRRVIKQQDNDYEINHIDKFIFDDKKLTCERYFFKNTHKIKNILNHEIYPEYFRCPYGEIKKKLWVRETWCVHRVYDNLKPSYLPDIKYLKNGIIYMSDYHGEKLSWMGKTRSPIFMPRKFSRIDLEIVNIRAERLQKITAADAVKEGISVSEFLDGWNAKHYFKKLWDSINGKKYSWSSNPWVWVIEFERVI